MCLIAQKSVQGFNHNIRNCTAVLGCVFVGSLGQTAGKVKRELLRVAFATDGF
jgi:hypothetical protein